MKKLSYFLVAAAAALSVVSALWAEDPLYYGPSLCKHPQFDCIKVKSGQSWKSLFPDEQDRDLVQRLNRTYNYLCAGKVIVIPKNLKELTILDIAPFPKQMDVKEKQIIVDQDN